MPKSYKEMLTNKSIQCLFISLFVFSCLGSFSANSKPHIEISLNDRYLYLMEGSVVLDKFPIAIGDPTTPTPIGDFYVMRKEPYPVYLNSRGKVFPANAKSPVGLKLITFQVTPKGEYSIHGTPWPVWVKTRSAITNGCIRMTNKDILKVYKHVSINSPVLIR